MSQHSNEEVARTLLSRIVARDERALTELHQLMAREVYAFAMHRLRDPEHAESVVVDTFWEVWQSGAKFRGDSRVSTWIFGIARNKGLELWRRLGPVHEDIDAYVDTLAAESSDVSALLEQRQESERLVGCLAQLSPSQRECMQLAHYQGLGLAEIADIQGVPENTVKTRMFHARRNLRNCLQLTGRIRELQ